CSIAGIPIQIYMAQNKTSISDDGEKLWGKRHIMASDPGHGQNAGKTGAQEAHIDQLSSGQAEEIGLRCQGPSPNGNQVCGGAAHVHKEAITYLASKKRSRSGPVGCGDMQNIGRVDHINYAGRVSRIYDVVSGKSIMAPEIDRTGE